VLSTAKRNVSIKPIGIFDWLHPACMAGVAVDYELHQGEFSVLFGQKRLES